MPPMITISARTNRTSMCFSFVGTGNEMFTHQCMVNILDRSHFLKKSDFTDMRTARESVSGRLQLIRTVKIDSVLTRQRSEKSECAYAIRYPALCRKFEVCRRPLGTSQSKGRSFDSSAQRNSIERFGDQRRHPELQG